MAGRVLKGSDSDCARSMIEPKSPLKDMGDGKRTRACSLVSGSEASDSRVSVLRIVPGLMLKKKHALLFKPLSWSLSVVRARELAARKRLEQGVPAWMSFVMLLTDSGDPWG